MKKIVTVLILLISTLVVQAQDAKIKDGTIFAGKVPIAKYIVKKFPVNRSNYQFLNINDSALFNLDLVKKEFWRGGPFEEFYHMSGAGIDTSIYISFKLNSTIEALASLIVSDKLIRDNQIDTAALRVFAKKHSLKGFEERKEKGLKALTENDSVVLGPTKREVIFEPGFEEKTILKEKQYAIHYKDRQNVGYFKMKELIIDGQKDYRISIFSKTKVELAIITYRQNKGYTARNMYTRRDKIYHEIPTAFNEEGLETVVKYLIKKAYL